MVGRIVIPARLASTRLPEKLLLSETGMSVLEHTYRASRLSQKTAGTIVAVDHPRLFQLVQSFGGEAIMTDPNAQSGTDRIAEVARAMPEVDIFVNVQGDEPEIAGKSIDMVLELLASSPQASVATLATPIRTLANLNDPACVKVVVGAEETALYFSRSPIPHPREWSESLLTEEPPLFLQHIGIYAYRRDFLLGLGGLKPSSLERLEKLEQLRFLQNGHKIVVGTIGESHRGIDTRADYDAFKSRWFEKYGRNPTN
ncbi:MAG: 3-deoxy-manno-octulosonate cytidylyltransferase [Pirellula sp.]|jgi:3-deoxy-manno-octulosonate cytidylyltransferase (CMP-KDO synthetase)